MDLRGIRVSGCAGTGGLPASLAVVDGAMGASSADPEAAASGTQLGHLAIEM